MIEWLKKLLLSKIQITIITPPPIGVEYTTTPRIIETTSPIIKKSKKTNYRFVESAKTDSISNEVWSIYYTEELVKGKWRLVGGSIASKKDRAIELHLKIISNASISPTTTNTVLWEGLDKSEAEVWAKLHK